MSTSTLNFTIIKTPETRYSDAQIFLREFTGKNFSRKDAASIWAKVQDHKWNMSENLRRDVGIRVAAIDFIENFYLPENDGAESSSFGAPFFARFKKMLRSYFELTGRALNY